jgi:putative phosphoribosyl transferase
MDPLFRNRTEAGQLLAERLLRYSHRAGVVVLALPRGGVPVGQAIASRLGLPLDILIVHKLSLPAYKELAIGALSSDGIRILNTGIIDEHAISNETIESIAAREADEIRRRETLYCGHRVGLAVENQTVILADDGIATGATVRAAIEVLRRKKAKRIIVAIPTIARATFHEIRSRVDELEAIIVPEQFESVGEWYEDFSQLTDEEVCARLASAGAKARSEGRT